MTVFRFNIFFTGETEAQQRFVVAETEKEAFDKMQKYHDEMVADGFADFTFVGGWVEIYSVIM